MSFLLVLVTALFSFFPLVSGKAMAWEPARAKKIRQSKIKVWQVQATTPEGKSVIYLVQSDPAQIRLFYAHTKYHHSISLASLGVSKITDVGVERSSQGGRGKILYLGDQTTQRMLSLNLGGKEIKEVPLEGGLKAYREFVAELHPVAEAERHL